MNFHPPADGRWEMTPRALHLGDTVPLADDANPWTVKAVTKNFAALTRPVTDADRKAHRGAYDEAHWDDDLADSYEELEGDVFYTVLDWRNGYRGPCNLIGQSYGDGDYAEAECAAMLAEFEAGDLEISHRNWERIAFADEVAA
ncbi:hypothetical protein ACIA5D_36720 [Actinoplanes sp. NPDC051513]|uniref:hypothetical protein n=1 Tax=Actinoplanes sp. NPDC051513 TaxID=3363908 RepID=UPI00379245E5